MTNTTHNWNAVLLKNFIVADNMNIPITKILVLHDKHGSDLICVHTDLPSSMPNVTSQPLILTFRAAADSGEEYVKNNFPNIPFTSINS
jgi:hypothetical protein